ncbi:GNAT family N-acetyltransferase [Pseudoflavitalea sp. G-6-1-2]|uniref:GNAT family N-acetyltransferase n=1 Tax=Pseudoflavitalea sp. G-6-1-2 TaxID=2728841 RepID=UPI00146C1AF3|nr:GNAT family N-acetyltransferase [Pseudoflavitalea sp. G-6-1-2]NML20312.1 GNAT family N-acetyltransferase [Pseudoflavitalea sp. G-6-1-2]
MQNISVVSYEAKYKSAYVSLNRAWIEKYFRIEPADEYVLQNPEETIIDKGGSILIALDDCTAAGVVGLRKIDNDVYEMIKMAVSEQYQGKGIGYILGKAIIEEAAKLGARKVILYSNKSLKPALSLYHKLGFTEVPLEPDNDYIRSDIKMELLLDNSTSSYRNNNENRQEPNAVF